MAPHGGCRGRCLQDGGRSPAELAVVAGNIVVANPAELVVDEPPVGSRGQYVVSAVVEESPELRGP